MNNIFYTETKIIIDTEALFIIKDKNQNQIDKTNGNIYSLTKTLMDISFENNSFLFNLFTLIDNKELFLLCKLLFEEKEFVFCLRPLTINIVDIIRKEFLINSTLKLSNKPTTKNNIVDLLTLIFMKDVKKRTTI